MHPIATQLQALRTELTSAFQEREEAVEAMMLAILSKEHVFVLGPPGTGKTMLAQAFASAFVGSEYFEAIMSKTRSAEAILGPLDIIDFRNTGNLRRKIDGYLLTAHFALLDEIGKMSPILGHDMLAALNERVRHEVSNGKSVHPVPLMTAFACSNEVPTDESDDAAALWDRLLFRCTVDYIQAGSAFADLMTGANPLDQITTKIDFDELKTAIEVDVPQVKLGPDALKAVLKLRKKLGDKNIHPGDRRWRQSMKALRSAAFLDGRDEIIEEDLAALRFTLWDTIPQIEDLTKLTSSASNPFVERLLRSKSALQQISTGVDERKDKSIADKTQYAQEINPKLTAIRKDLDDLLTEAKGRPIPNFKPVSDLHHDLVRRMYLECFELDEATAEIALAQKLGLGDGSQVTP